VSAHLPPTCYIADTLTVLSLLLHSMRNVTAGKRMRTRTKSSARLVMTSVLGHDTTFVRSTGTPFNPLTMHHQYSWFHLIFAIGAMYVAMLLTDWNVVRPGKADHNSVYIGRSETAMWMRIVSSWICMLLYIWSLVAPLIMPDR
jgi:hypothetical protein